MNCLTLEMSQREQTNNRPRKILNEKLYFIIIFRFSNNNKQVKVLFSSSYLKAKSAKFHHFFRYPHQNNYLRMMAFYKACIVKIDILFGIANGILSYATHKDINYGLSLCQCEDDKLYDRTNDWSIKSFNAKWSFFFFSTNATNIILVFMDVLSKLLFKPVEMDNGYLILLPLMFFLLLLSVTLLVDGTFYEQIYTQWK